MIRTTLRPKQRPRTTTRTLTSVLTKQRTKIPTRTKKNRKTTFSPVRQRLLQPRQNRWTSSVLILTLLPRLVSLFVLLRGLLVMTSRAVIAMGEVVVGELETMRAVTSVVVVVSVVGLRVASGTVTSVRGRLAKKPHLPVNLPRAVVAMTRTGMNWTSGCGTIPSRLFGRPLHRLRKQLAMMMTLERNRRSVRRHPGTILKLQVVVVAVVVAVVEAAIGGVPRNLRACEQSLPGLMTTVRWAPMMT